MLDIQDGTLHLPGGASVTPSTGADSAAMIGFEDHGDINGFHVLSSSPLYLWDRNFAMTLRFTGGKLQFIALMWIDGPVARLGYDATTDDLLNEKRQLVKMLSKHLGRGPADTSLGADCFPFPWGVVCARADPRSTCCSIAFNYFYRPGQ